MPCTFELAVPGLGYLDGNVGGHVSLHALLYTRIADREQMKEGSKIELPLWLGEMLAVRYGDYLFLTPTRLGPTPSMRLCNNIFCFLTPSLFPCHGSFCCSPSVSLLHTLVLSLLQSCENVCFHFRFLLPSHLLQHGRIGYANVSYCLAANVLAPPPCHARPTIGIVPACPERVESGSQNSRLARSGSTLLRPRSPDAGALRGRRDGRCAQRCKS